MRAEITALPTYGYRRAGALVNRTRALMGLQAINHKRFYRVMKEYRLLLPKAPKRASAASARGTASASRQAAVNGVQAVKVQPQAIVTGSASASGGQ